MVPHVEIDNTDMTKAEQIKEFFTKSSKKVDKNFLRDSLTYVLAFSFEIDEDTKVRIVDNAKIQQYLGRSIKSTTLSALNLNNWYDKQKQHTLLCKLMAVESIYQKTVAKSKNTKNKSYKENW